MITPSGATISEYSALLEGDSAQHIRITFLLDGTTFSDEDFETRGCSITTYMNPDIDLTFGVAYMSEIKLSFFRSSKTDQLNWTREFSVELGVEDEGVTNWVQIGIFAGSRPLSTLDYVIEFTAYDRMQRFEKKASDFTTLLTYPCSLQDIYDQLCTFAGVPNVSGDEMSTIMSRTFSSAFSLEGIDTCRDLLAKIAESTGCYAKITNDGNTKMVWYEDHLSDYSLMRDIIFGIESTNLVQSTGMRWSDLSTYTWSTMENLTWGELFHRDNAQVYEAISAEWTNPEESYTQPTTVPIGARVYTITNNPFVHYGTAQAIRDHLQLILNRLDDFKIYYVANAVAVGNWLVEPGDLIKFEMEDGSFETYPIFSRVLTWNGYCECEYESTGNLVK